MDMPVWPLPRMRTATSVSSDRDTRRDDEAHQIEQVEAFISGVVEEDGVKSKGLHREREIEQRRLRQF